MPGPNPHVLQRLTAIQQSLMAQRDGAVGLPSAVAGPEREVFLRAYLQTVFPAHRRFSTGVITDVEGRISGQVDIAVEFGFSPSFPMPVTDQRLLLAESVALVIEVKSDLTRQWKEVVATTREVKKLKRELNAVIFGAGPPNYIPTLAVGYRGHSTVDGLVGRLDSTPEDSRPDGALVIESGCFAGFGMTAHGPAGLYALALAIDAVLRQLLLMVRRPIRLNLSQLSAKPFVSDFARSLFSLRHGRSGPLGELTARDGSTWFPWQRCPPSAASRFPGHEVLSWHRTAP